MESYDTITLLYILFIWLVVLHTFEEIVQGIFGVKIGPIKMSLKKYLVGASIITSINLGTLSLIITGSKIGLYLGIFTSSTIGILQVIVHAIGFFKEGRKTKRLGAGFYSSIPLSAVGAVLLFHIIKKL